MEDEKPNEESESSLLLLADELIDMMLSYSFIDHKDLCSCAQVCRRLYIIATGNELWKKKALSKWNFWKNIPRENWLAEYRDRLLMECKVHHTLQTLSIKYYTKTEVYKNDLERFVHLANNNPSHSCHMDDTLCELLQGDVCKVNLTYRYYARKVKSYLKIHQLKDGWEKFLELPDEQQHLEKGAMLIAKWILNEEDIDEHNTFSELDNIAQMVQDSLCGYRNTSSSNTASTVSLEERAPRSNEEFAVVAHPAACLRILDSLKHVLYQQLQFKGNVNEYYRKENSMLHQVLKNRTGNPITLSVLFTAVARRLGVNLDPINFPRHFLLRWRANLDAEANHSTAFKYIDCFNGGRFLSEEQCIDLILLPSFEDITARRNVDFIKATPRQVFIRMVANIINSYRTGEQEDDGLRGLHSSLNLALLLNPTDESSRLLLTRIQLHLGIDLDEAIVSLESLERSALSNHATIARGLLVQANQKKAEQEQTDDTPQPKRRSDPAHSEVGFKVGMVMRHKLYHYGCVIYGWDPVCRMDELWIQRMGVDNSPGGRSQPFYNVLGNDCSTRYAAHINLREDPNQSFNPHPELGKYFKGFTGTRYIPNESLQQEYPEDVIKE